MDAKTLTFDQAAVRMGISRREFYRLKAKGVFDRAGLFAPLAHRISVDRLDAWLANQPLPAAALRGLRRSA